MAYQLKPDESVGKGVRRIALGQIDKALDELTGLSGEPTGEVVHGARKRFKRVRAVLRLARAGLGRRRFDRENQRFRDAGRPLSRVRDAGVLVDAFDQLVERRGSPGHPEAADAVRSFLKGRKDEEGDRVLHEDKALAAVTASMQEARRAAKRWSVEGGDWPVLRAGLKRVYRAGYQAFRAAADSPTDETLHECRKRVKDLWYALDLLAPVRPEFTAPVADRAHKLADALGDDHDLAVLRQVLCEPDHAPPAPAAETFLPMIDDRRDELRREALDLGRSVYAESPRDFLDRFEAYWHAWRSESLASQFD